jgi:repressor LexA
MGQGRRTRLRLQQEQQDRRERTILGLLAEIVHAGFTFRELAPRVGAAHSTVYEDLQRLLTSGEVECVDPPPSAKDRSYRLARAYRITPKGAHRIGASGMPVVASVAAGEPILFDPSGQRRTLKDALGLKLHHDYILEVDGYSMIDTGINPGDLLMVRPEAPEGVRDGETVVVVVRDQDTDTAGLTVKRWYREPDRRIRLQPSHLELGVDPEAQPYQPLYYDHAQVQLCGRLLGVICPADGGRGRFPRI